MLDYETDQDTHFQCPHCGQKGSVPTATLEKALAATPHVHISCSSCGQKFEPFASPAPMDTMPPEAAETASPQGEEGTGISPRAERATNNIPVPDDAGRDLPPLADHFHAGQETDEDAADEDGSEGSLPGWMMPPPKPAPAETEIAPVAEPDDTPPPNSDDETGNDDGDDNDAALIEDIAAYHADTPDAQDRDPPENKDDDKDEDADEDDLKGEDDYMPSTTEAVNLADDMPDALTQAPIEDGFDAGEELDALDADALLGAVDDKAPPPAPHVMAGAAQDALLIDDIEEGTGFEASEADPAPRENQPPPVENPAVPMPYRDAGTQGPIGVVNGMLLLLVALLAAMNLYVLLQEDTAPLRPAMNAAPSLETKALRVENTAFEVSGNRVIIAVLFANETQTDGIIGDFRIHLQNEAGDALASWTELSKGQSVGAGDRRTVTSVLVAPPANIARVAVDYPPEN